MNDTGNKNRAVESECGPFHLSQLRGAQSIVFTKAPYLLSAASVAGSKEAQGPLGKCFDLTNEDDLFGAETWEEAESNMQKEACVLALGKSHVDPKSVRYLFGGDLLRQGIATSMGVEDLQIPIFGLYGACSTSGEALALAAMSVAAGYGDYMLAVTSSHFGSAEKEFRFPLGYANQRPLSAHWTVTASGAFLVGSHLNKIHSDKQRQRKSQFRHIRITGVTIGKIVDFGLKDSQNMDERMTSYNYGFGQEPDAEADDPAEDIDFDEMLDRIHKETGLCEKVILAVLKAQADYLDDLWGDEEEAGEEENA